MTENVTLVMLRYLKVFYIPLLLLSGFFPLTEETYFNLSYIGFEHVWGRHTWLTSGAAETCISEIARLLKYT